MKAIILASILVLSTGANAAVLCQSMKDPSFQQWFEGWQCPSGYYLIRTK